MLRFDSSQPLARVAWSLVGKSLVETARAGVDKMDRPILEPSLIRGSPIGQRWTNSTDFHEKSLMLDIYYFGKQDEGSFPYWYCWAVQNLAD